MPPFVRLNPCKRFYKNTNLLNATFCEVEPLQKVLQEEVSLKCHLLWGLTIVKGFTRIPISEMPTFVSLNHCKMFNKETNLWNATFCEVEPL